MNVRCARVPLLAALQSASAVVPARSPKPVLANVKIEAGRDGAVLSATDLEVGIRSDVEGVEVAAPGSVLLPSGRLMAIVRESSPGTVFEIQTDGTAAVVKAPRSQFRLRSSKSPRRSFASWYGGPYSPPTTSRAGMRSAVCFSNSRSRV